MRIISGTSRGRRLATRRGQAIRPTSDRVKGSIFNSLGDDVAGKHVLDLFAGTGNLGLEALSRGAIRVVFVEKERQAALLIQKNLLTCGMQMSAEVLTTSASRAIEICHQRSESFDLILMDPPYRQGMVQATLRELGVKAIHHEGSILVVQHDRREPLPDITECWNVIRQRRMGDTVISFLKPRTLSPVGAVET
jgi:16S rRNA (guanine966-N2)-methyltransferase